MRLPFFFAKRYLFSKKSTNAINIISGISMLGVLIGSAALILILSVFNGFEHLVLSMYNKFSPDISIEPAIGKTFNPNTPAFKKLRKDEQLQWFTEVLEERALLRYDKQQYIGTIKGLSDDFLKTKSLDSMIIRGQAVLKDNGIPFAIVGSGVEYYLGMNINSDEPLVLFSPRKRVSGSIDPSNDLTRGDIHVAGVFQVQQDFDSKYVLVPLEFARKQLDEPNDVSSIALYLKSDTDAGDYIKQVRNTVGADFKVKDRFQQNELLYKILNSEKWAVYLILTFVLLIAICNIIGSLTMLVIDKKKDVAILFSMGADESLIRRIFLFEGLLIALGGTVAGLSLGSLLCFLQKKFGLIKLGGSGSFIMDTYPVEMKFSDFALVFATVFIISFVASWVASRSSVKSFRGLRQELVEN